MLNRLTQRPPRLEFSPYEMFTHDEWAKLRADTPMTLSEEEVGKLSGLIERMSADEVEQIYLPLSRLLNLYVARGAGAARAHAEFLGAAQRQGALHHRHRRLASRSARAPRPACCRRCWRAGRITRASISSPPTASCCPTPSWSAAAHGPQGLSRKLRPARRCCNFLADVKAGRAQRRARRSIRTSTTISCPARRVGRPARHPHRRGPQRAADRPHAEGRRGNPVRLRLLRFLDLSSMPSRRSSRSGMSTRFMRAARHRLPRSRPPTSTAMRALSDEDARRAALEIWRAHQPAEPARRTSCRRASAPT